MGLALFPEDLVALRCGECNVSFGMPKALYEDRKADGRTFYCVNGHPRAFCDTKADRLERELAQQKKRTEWAQQAADRQRARADREERSARSIKGHATRLRKRLAQGKCPCCSATFKDLEQHIAEKHPRYNPKEPTP